MLAHQKPSFHHSLLSGFSPVLAPAAPVKRRPREPDVAGIRLRGCADRGEQDHEHERRDYRQAIHAFRRRPALARTSRAGPSIHHQHLPGSNPEIRRYRQALLDLLALRLALPRPVPNRSVGRRNTAHERHLARARAPPAEIGGGASDEGCMFLRTRDGAHQAEGSAGPSDRPIPRGRAAGGPSSPRDGRFSKWQPRGMEGIPEMRPRSSSARSWSESSRSLRRAPHVPRTAVRDSAPSTSDRKI